MSAPHDHAPIIVTHEGGARFATHVRSHRLIVDQPPRGGGEDSGPMPIELLGAALGTCVALYVQRFCQSRELPYEGLRVEVDQLRAANPNRVVQFDVRVMLAHELPEHHAVALERVVKSCPVHNTSTEATAVTLLIRGSRRSRVTAQTTATFTT